ncbi:hypothetical protein JCM10207_003952 [Rhodosporidiobolus poonsookiae]
MSQPQALSRPAAAPPTPQEIERKLGSPTIAPPPAPTLSSSLESVDLQRRFSNASRRGHGSMSSGDEEDAPSPPLRPQPHLSAISEAEDAVASGSESDASSLNGGGGEGRRSSRPDELRVDASRASRDSGGLSENATLKSGYLMKKGEKRKTWKKRWFVLRSGQLAMYKTDKEYRLLRLIPIADIHSVSPVELKKHANAFAIVTPHRAFYVEAPSAAEVKEWCQLIDRAKSDYRSRATVTSLDTPTDTAAPTPVGPSPAQTPRMATYQPQPAPPTQGSVAIPIPSASLAGGGGAPVSGSYVSSAFAPSSYQSTASSLSSAPHGASTNSFAPPPLPSPSLSLSFGCGGLGLQPGDGELQSLDAGLEQLGLGAGPGAGADERGAPQRSSSGRSDGLAVPGTGAGPNGPLSPGIASSSEEEDGFEAYEQQYGSPGSYAPAPVQQQQQYYASPSSAAQAPVQAPAPPVPSVSFVDPNKIILSGYLMKQGKRKNWRKRWFVLQSGMLAYSRSHMDTKTHRQIPMSSILDAIEYDSAAQQASKRPSHPLSPTSPTFNPSSSESRTYDHCFKIITPKRTYLCCAPTEEDEIKWLAALQCLVARRTQAAVRGTTVPAPAPAASSLSAGANQPPTRSLSTPVPAPTAAANDTLSAAAASAVKRSPSQSQALAGVLSGPTAAAPPPMHTRQRSVTDAARQAVRDVERRFHPPAMGAPAQ